ncbi:Protein of unknown function [Bacillus cytotoxicus]|uniref:Uncharacterized protein n=1 Tax=Bacillus cytotoxicus TaxID=580165 RepID=A0AAX2CHK9_9BACI|nr:Protein of unknown function [Bacillus cytotoxicus]
MNFNKTSKTFFYVVLVLFVFYVLPLRRGFPRIILHSNSWLNAHKVFAFISLMAMGCRPKRIIQNIWDMHSLLLIQSHIL